MDANKQHCGQNQKGKNILGVVKRRPLDVAASTVARLEKEVAEAVAPLGGFERKDAIVWETPEARMNCSRSSRLVRPNNHQRE